MKVCASTARLIPRFPNEFGAGGSSVSLEKEGYEVQSATCATCQKIEGSGKKSYFDPLFLKVIRKSDTLVVSLRPRLERESGRRRAKVKGLWSGAKG